MLVLVLLPLSILLPFGTACLLPHVLGSACLAEGLPCRLPPHAGAGARAGPGARRRGPPQGRQRRYQPAAQAGRGGVPCSSGGTGCAGACTPAPAWRQRRPRPGGYRTPPLSHPLLLPCAHLPFAPDPSAASAHSRAAMAQFGADHPAASSPCGCLAAAVVQARDVLALTAVPRSLPCRDVERGQVAEFVQEVLAEGGARVPGGRELESCSVCRHPAAVEHRPVPELPGACERCCAAPSLLLLMCCCCCCCSDLLLLSCSCCCASLARAQAAASASTSAASRAQARLPPCWR